MPTKKGKPTNREKAELALAVIMVLRDKAWDDLDAVQKHAGENLAWEDVSTAADEALRDLKAIGLARGSDRVDEPWGNPWEFIRDKELVALASRYEYSKLAKLLGISERDIPSRVRQARKRGRQQQGEEQREKARARKDAIRNTPPEPDKSEAGFTAVRTTLPGPDGSAVRAVRFVETDRLTDDQRANVVFPEDLDSEDVAMIATVDRDKVSSAPPVVTDEREVEGVERSAEHGASCKGVYRPQSLTELSESFGLRRLYFSEIRRAAMRKGVIVGKWSHLRWATVHGSRSHIYWLEAGSPPRSLYCAEEPVWRVKPLESYPLPDGYDPLNWEASAVDRVEGSDEEDLQKQLVMGGKLVSRLQATIEERDAEISRLRTKLEAAAPGESESTPMLRQIAREVIHAARADGYDVSDGKRLSNALMRLMWEVSE